MSRDTYFINEEVLKSNPMSGIDEVAIVKRPAIELEGLTLAEQAKEESVLNKLNFDGEKMQIAGYFSLSDFPIYRRDDDNYEYDLIFGKEAIRLMHQKMMEIKVADGFKINFEHRNEDALNDYKEELTKLGFTNGDIPANIFNIDLIDTDIKKDFIKQQYGIEFPEKYKDSIGSFMTVQVNNKDYFNFLKENGIKSFSLEGFFSKVYQELKQNFNKNKQENMDKQFFRKPTKKGAKTMFSFQFKSETFATKEEILMDIPVGTDYAELLGDESYKGFTGKEEWTSLVDGTVFDVIVEDGLVTDIVITSEAPTDGETPDPATGLADTPEDGKKEGEGDAPADAPKGMTEEDKAAMEAFITSKFEEEVKPKIDEVIEMITELRASFEDEKIKEGDKEALSKKENTETNKKVAFNNVIKNHLLNRKY